MKNIFIFLPVLFCFVCQNVQAQNDQSILRDRYAYETATEMYAITDTATFTPEAAAMVEKINTELSKGKMLEDDTIWSMLQQLEPYRMSEQVRKAVQQWVIAMRHNLSSIHIETAYKNLADTLKTINQAYKTHDFNRMIDLSRRLSMKKRPSELLSMIDYSIRNNMALALMHQHKDLCALVELEFINQSEKNKYSEREMYIPAMINLTVLYERLGRSADADTLSKKLLDYTKKEEITVPMVNFNAAWYLDLNNYQNEKANSILDISNVLNKTEAGKYQTLYKSARATYQSHPVSEIGVAGKLGFFGGGSKKTIGIVIFLIVNIALVVAYSFRVGDLWRDSQKKKKFIWLWVFLVLIGFFHLLFWGLNLTVGGVFLMIVSFIVFLLLLRLVYTL